ncbi:MAG: hypothetical protein KKD28_02385 [Chloroflexi bacterium]|nr:hypothetical protein [Chloroflexota bacterium]MBU1660304.1 hypothetical protein [Chloroflexota bacterium]
MFLLVSTPLQILLVNSASGQTSVLRAGDGYYYGITYKEGTLVLSHSGGYLGYYNERDAPIHTTDHLIQPHQIEWVDDKVLVANTGKNCISVFDEKGHLCRDVYLNEICWDDKNKGRMGNHFNSVHKSSDRIYVVAHNYHRPSEVWELSWPDLEVVGNTVSRAGWAHNFWANEWGWVTCNSKQGSLQDVSTGETIWASNEEGVMTRGLAVSEDHIFIGYSLHNERKERYWKNGGVWIVDRKTLKTVEKILFPGSGDVHEIRLVGVPDECHNDQVIPLERLDSIRSLSPLIGWAYELRKTRPSFRRDVFPVSQLVRTTQMSVRWRKSFQRTVSRGAA